MHGDKFWLSSQEVLLLSKGVEARDAANHPMIHGTAFYNKELTSLFVNSAEADRASGLPGKQASWDEQDLVLLEPRGGGSWEWEFWTASDQWVFPVLPPPLLSTAQEGACQDSSGAVALGTVPTSPGPRHCRSYQ